MAEKNIVGIEVMPEVVKDLIYGVQGGKDSIKESYDIPGHDYFSP